MFRNSTLEMPCSVEKVLGKMFTKTLNFMGVDVSLSVIVVVLLCKTISLLHFQKKKKGRKTSELMEEKKDPRTLELLFDANSTFFIPLVNYFL